MICTPRLVMNKHCPSSLHDWLPRDDTGTMALNALSARIIGDLLELILKILDLPQSPLH